MKPERYETCLNLAAHPLTWCLARLARRVGAFWRVPGLGVVVSDAKWAREILRRDADFTKNGPGSFAKFLTQGLGEMALGNMDGAQHRTIRDALEPVLAPARAARIIEGRKAELHAMGSEIASGRIVDIAHFARGWAGRIAFDVVGVAPPAGQEEFASHELVRLSASLSSVLGFRRPSKKAILAAHSDREELAEYFRAAYGKPAPEGSLVQQLQHLGLGFDDALGLLLIYVIGGTLTVSSALPRIVALLADSGSYPRIVEDPTLIPQAIDEGLRFTTPLPGTVRIVRQDTVLGNYKLRKNTRLVILTCNLGRDPQFFDAPDSFDITRRYNPRAGRLWYGAGAHRCVGFSLAQRELKEGLGCLARSASNLQVVGRKVSYSVLLPAYERLLIRAAGTP